MILRGGSPGHGWTPVDQVLAVAWVHAQDKLCSGCGHPRDEAWNPHSAGWYEAREAECQGCAAIARAADADKKPRSEIKRWVVDERPPEQELPQWTPGAATRLVPGHAGAGAQG